MPTTPQEKSSSYSQKSLSTSIVIVNPMGKPQIPKDFCDEILKLNKLIRFAALVDKSGNIIRAEYRKGVNPLLSEKASESFVKQAAVRMNAAEAVNKLFYEADLGKVVYSSMIYANVKRATIPLSNSLLMVSFQTEADHESIILKKILPLLRRLGLTEMPT